MTEPIATPADPIAADAAGAESVASPVATAGAPTSPTSEPAAAPAHAQGDAGAVGAITPRTRVRVLAGLARFARFVVVLAILAVGIALGYARFQALQPASSNAGSPATTGIEAPASVRGMVLALGRNDLEAARSSVPPIRNTEGALVADPYLLLAGELRAMQLQEVRGVRTLSTFVDGPRTATAIIILGRTTPGADLSRHLIVQTLNGTIVSFK